MEAEEVRNTGSETVGKPPAVSAFGCQGILESEEVNPFFFAIYSRATTGELPPKIELHPPIVKTKLLNVTETAALLGVSPSNIYTMVKNKALPSIRLNNWALRFSPDALKKWATDNTGTARTPTT